MDQWIGEGGDGEGEGVGAVVVEAFGGAEGAGFDAGKLADGVGRAQDGGLVADGVGGWRKGQRRENDPSDRDSRVLDPDSRVNTGTVADLRQ